MSPVTVLITFYSRCGSTETLASAAAVGAVQQRANIRLRRVPDRSAEKTLEEYPDCRDTLVRMHKEYVAPTEADVVGADALVLVPPAGFDVSSAEWANYLAVLEKLASEGKLVGKVGTIVDAGNESTSKSFAAAIHQLGLAVPPEASRPVADAAERAREQGRQVASLARTRKRAGL
jgi:multimeric flavodoxin WrbA